MRGIVHDFHRSSRRPCRDLFDVQIMRGHGLGHVEPHNGIELTGFFGQAAAFADDREALQSTATDHPEFIGQEPALSIFDK
jgi:hypothetical protein